jgi:hypothetical protein
VFYLCSICEEDNSKGVGILDNEDNDVLWGGFFGFVLGLIVAKVYSGWAIIYRLDGTGFSGVDGWRSGILRTPLWVRATDYPMTFTIIVVLLFVIIGVLFTKYLINRNKSELNE